jgi:hypothetical protein
MSVNWAGIVPYSAIAVPERVVIRRRIYATMFKPMYTPTDTLTIIKPFK